MTAFTDAAVAKIKAVRTPSPRVYEPNKVPASPQTPYAVVYALGDRGDSYTLDSTYGVRFYRVVAQSFGTSEGDAGAYDEYVTAALLDESLSVAGYDCTPCRIEVGSALVRDPDTGGAVGITSTFTFTATKE